jgi:CHASE3 domain sensor protein
MDFEEVKTLYEQGKLEPDALFSIIEELQEENRELQERISDLETSIQEDYTPKNIDPYEEYGISRDDF